MKKILSLLLCVVLVLGVCYLPVFASGSTASAKEAQKVLSDLDIIEANAELSETITRGEFVLEISKAMNIVKMPSGYKLPYADVSEGSKYYEGVYNLYAWRVISEAPAFRPDDVITSHEALKIAVATLGYDFLALANGGYPTGYVAAATQLGIVPKGMNANLTVGNAYELIYNMLHCKLSTVTYTDSGEYNYSVKTGNTVLYEMWGLSVVSGTVTDGETFGINYDDGVGEGFVGIDGMKLKKGAFDTDSYFGESVDVYYENDSKVVRAILPRDDGSNKITKIVSSQDIKFENNTYTYIASDDEEEEEGISDDCTIVYNGQNVNFDKSIMVPEHGSVKLVSLGGGKADVVIIKSYDEMVAGTIVTSSLLISDKATTGNSVIFDGDNITYADQNGNVSDFGKIVENDVLWIAYDKNGEINDVIICSDVIVGELTGKSSNGIYIDDRMYTATDAAYADATQNYEFGSVVRGCINPDGDIVYFVSENDTTGYKIGYLMYSRLFSHGLSSEIRVKILGSDGLYYEYAMADKFIVNGIVFKDEASANYANLPKQEGYESSMAMSIILYVADKTDHITQLNYPDDIAKTINVDGKIGEARGIWKNAEITDLDDQYVQYKSSDNVLYSKNPTGRIFQGSPFTRFLVPDPKNTGLVEDKDYKIQGASGYMTKQTHYGYALSEDAVASDYIVSTYYESGASGSHADTAQVLMVKSISQIINDEGDSVEKIEIVRPNATTAEYYSEEMGYFSAFNLKFGDLVKIEANSKNMVTGLTVFYRSGEDTLNTIDIDGTASIESDLTVSYSISEGNCIFNSNSGMNSLAGSYIILGDVYHRYDAVMRLLPSHINPGDYVEGSHTLYPFSMTGKSIVVCNLSEETITSGIVGDVKSYLEFGDNCNRVFIQAYSGTVNCIYVFQD